MHKRPDTLLKIASLFSSAVVSGTHDLLLANLFRHYKAEISAELFQASVPSKK
jgi:hypothetical protein